MGVVIVILSCLVGSGIVAFICGWTFERIERETEEEAKRIKTQGGPPWKLE